MCRDPGLLGFSEFMDFRVQDDFGFGDLGSWQGLEMISDVGFQGGQGLGT